MTSEATLNYLPLEISIELLEVRAGREYSGLADGWPAATYEYIAKAVPSLMEKRERKCSLFFLLIAPGRKLFNCTFTSGE